MRLRLLPLLALWLPACSGPSKEFYTFTGPARADFAPVGEALGSRCGSLDCHGAVARNFRVYSRNGLRIGGVTAEGNTTPEEYDATYTSLVSIQPEILEQVLVEGGVKPERWVVVAKGNGTVHHKGGVAMSIGSAADRCLRSWLASALDTAACQEAFEYLAPVPP